MENIEVSIIVPVYNVVSYLDQCIESLVSQTFENIEIILIDDGSTDGSAAICDNWGNEDRRIKVRHQENQGVSVARNNGIQISAAKYILFVDPDDWLEKDCCDILLCEAKKSESDVILFHHYIENNGKRKRFGKSKKRDVSFDKESLQIAVLKQDYEQFGIALDVPWCRLIKRSVIQDNDIFFPPGLRISQDGIFNLYLFEFAEKVTISDYYGYHYRLNEHSINYRYNPDMQNIIKRFVIESQKFITKYHKDVYYENALGVRCITMIGRVENTFLFHNSSGFNRKQIIAGYIKYLNDDLLKKYLSKVEIKDINKLSMKIRYLCVNGNIFFLNLYYLLILIKNKTLRIAKIN